MYLSTYEAELAVHLAWLAICGGFSWHSQPVVNLALYLLLMSCFPLQWTLLGHGLRIRVSKCGLLNRRAATCYLQGSFCSRPTQKGHGCCQSAAKVISCLACNTSLCYISKYTYCLPGPCFEECQRAYMTRQCGQAFMGCSCCILAVDPPAYHCPR